MADSPDKDEEIKAEIAGYNSDEGVPFQFRTHKQRSDRSNKERDSIEDTIKHKIYEKSMKGKTSSGFSSSSLSIDINSTISSGHWDSGGKKDESKSDNNPLHTLKVKDNNSNNYNMEITYRDYSNGEYGSNNADKLDEKGMDYVENSIAENYDNDSSDESEENDSNVESDERKKSENRKSKFDGVTIAKLKQSQTESNSDGKFKFV